MILQNSSNPTHISTQQPHLGDKLFFRACVVFLIGLVDILITSRRTEFSVQFSNRLSVGVFLGKNMWAKQKPWVLKGQEIHIRCYIYDIFRQLGVYTLYCISYHIISYHIISYHIMSYIISYHTVDGGNPARPGYKELAKNRRNYQPQLVSRNSEPSTVSFRIISYHIISYHM